MTEKVCNDKKKRVEVLVGLVKTWEIDEIKRIIQLNLSERFSLGWKFNENIFPFP